MALLISPVSGEAMSGLRKENSIQQCLARRTKGAIVFERHVVWRHL